MTGLRCYRSALLAVVLSAIGASHARAQSLLFTVAAPEQTSAVEAHPSAVVEERGLALWTGASSDFGVGVDVAGGRWTVRAITSLATRLAGDDRVWAFQQVEVLRPLFSTASTSVAGGGGIRQEWDGTRVLVGRVLAGADVAGGRLQGSLFLERASQERVKHDAADVVTTVGWSRTLGDRIAIGAEGIGQDLEGFWDAAEAEGGAKLLVGPSLRVRSRRGSWTVTATAGPVLRSPSTAMAQRDGHHFGFFASAGWVPSRR